MKVCACLTTFELFQAPDSVAWDILANHYGLSQSFLGVRQSLLAYTGYVIDHFMEGKWNGLAAGLKFHHL